MNLARLEELLEKNRIDFSLWGKTSSSKPLSSLLKEINESESVLDERASVLIRHVSIAYVKINYETKFLVEDRSEWKDGRPPRRRKMNCSVAEKMLLGEFPIVAAFRGTREELGLTITPSTRFIFDNETNSREDSSSYPGLMTDSRKYWFSLDLNDTEYDPDGYKEESEDKITFFRWISR